VRRNRKRDVGQGGKTMRIPFKAFAVVCVATSMTAGCDLLHDAVQKVSVEPVLTFTTDEKNLLAKDDQFSVVNLDGYKFINSDSKTAYEMARDDRTGFDRNRLQSAILARSDEKCATFRKVLFAAHGVRKVGFRALTLALSGVGAVVTGSASQALSGASAGFQGMDETVDAELLQKQTIALILQTISSTRNGLMQEINEKRKVALKDYPAEEAIQDAIKYHRLCSLTESLAVLGRAVEENQKNKEKAEGLKEQNTKLEEEKRELKIEKKALEKKDKT